MKERPTVYIVHAVDTEGILREPVAATWERIYQGDKFWMPVEPTDENLQKLQQGKLDLNVPEEFYNHLRRKYSPENLAYLSTWEDLDESILRATNSNFREKYSDSDGGEYTYSWMIYDSYGFSNNPRFHAEGIHAIWDHYHNLFLNDNPESDGVYWHYHHVASSQDALEWSTNWGLNSIHEEILTRRIIERQWFPSVFRAGATIERNDLSHWLEMFIPFDFSARSATDGEDAMYGGHFRDWRHAPTDWGYYHPDWYDYRRPGQMKRFIFRCLDIRTWEGALNESDVEQAFVQAKEQGKSYNHDYRDMERDVDIAYQLLKRVSSRFPDVNWCFRNALQAARDYLGRNDKAPEFEWELKGSRLVITCDVNLFGPEPFLAIQEDGRFFRDNTTREGDREWAYTFRRPSEVQGFGVAGNSPMGNTGVLAHRGRLDELI